jgi:2-oxoglutarate dehydrogenase E1 component
MAEQAAFASLVTRVRGAPLGPGLGRGTFSHRHAVSTDVKTGAEVFPLDRRWPRTAARFSGDRLVAVGARRHGLRVRLLLDTPDGLVLWEAQFGDFVNGAQVIIDQYLAASEQKWHRCSRAS